MDEAAPVEKNCVKEKCAQQQRKNDHSTSASRNPRLHHSPSLRRSYRGCARVRWVVSPWGVSESVCARKSGGGGGDGGGDAHCFQRAVASAATRWQARPPQRCWRWQVACLWESGERGSSLHPLPGWLVGCVACCFASASLSVCVCGCRQQQRHVAVLSCITATPSPPSPSRLLAWQTLSQLRACACCEHLKGAGAVTSSAQPRSRGAKKHSRVGGQPHPPSLAAVAQCVCVCVQSTPLDMQPRAMWSVSATQHSRHKARQHGSTQASLSSPSRGARRVESATPSGDGASNVCASWLSLVVVVRRQRLCECLSVVAATKAHKSPPKRQRGEISHSLSHLLGGCSSTFSTALTAWLPLLLLEQVEDVFAKRTSRSSFLDFSSFCM